jgi:hypothetical protein
MRFNLSQETIMSSTTRSLTVLRLTLVMLLSLYSLVAACASSSKPSANSVLKPFTTDGCSLWVDGTLEHPNLWRHCCVAHDKAYWLGGTAEQRKQADEELEICVKQEQGAAMADYMYGMVRWGGHPNWLTPYRWGYGWNYLDKGTSAPREYKTPTPNEQRQIDELVPEADKIIASDEIKHPANKTFCCTSSGSSSSSAP